MGPTPETAELEREHWTRRGFVGAALAGGAASLLVGCIDTRDDKAASAQSTTTTQEGGKISGNAFLEVEGASMPLVSAAGGTKVIDVAQSIGTRSVAATGVRVEPITLGVQMTYFATPASPLLQWVLGTQAGQRPDRSGTTNWLGSTGNLITRVFTGGRITEVRMGALDAGSKNVALMNASVTAVDTSVRRAATGKAPLATTAPLLAANFRVTIDGVETQKVNSVGDVVLKASGGSLVAEAVKVTVVETDLATWEAWLEQALRDPARAARNASISYLSSDLKAVRFTVRLLSCLITRIDLAPFETTADTLRRATATIVPSSVVFEAVR